RATVSGDTINLNGFGALHEIGNLGNDIFKGTTSASYLEGGGGYDQFQLNLGTFNLVVMGDTASQYYGTGETNDYVLGGAGNDWLGIGNSGATLSTFCILNGGAGNDFVGATGNNNTLYGADGNDRLDANGNNNLLSGGNNDDVMTCGAGKASNQNT